MSILVDTETKLCVSGITGREGTFHAMNNRRYGTQVVSGVTPGKGGQDVEGVPVFNTFHDAVAETGANTAMIFVPPRFAADSILEAEDAGISLVICITEGIPASWPGPAPFTSRTGTNLPRGALGTAASSASAVTLFLARASSTSSP